MKRFFAPVFTPALLLALLSFCVPLYSSAVTQAATTPTAASSPQVIMYSPEIFLTWQAQTYVPPAYTGRAMPTANSPIVASIVVIDQGKIVDTTGLTIYWYIDGNQLNSATDQTSATFDAAQSTLDTMEVNVQIPSYNGSFLSKTIYIPLVNPEVVIDAPYTNNEVSGASFEATADPYFFDTLNPLDIALSWQIDGNAPDNAENPQTLTVNIPANTPRGSTIALHLDAQIPNEDFGDASADKTFTYVP